MSNVVSVHLILLFAQVCFASLPVAGRLAMHGSIGPAVIVLARITGGALVFALLAWRRGVLRIARADIPLFIACAVLGVAANQELYIQGLARSTATNASVLGSTIPVFTALVAIALGREPIHPRRLLGIAVAFGGVAALVGADRMSMDTGHLAGSAMILLNSLCYGTYLVIVRPLAEKYDPLTVVAWLFIIAAPIVVPLSVVELAHAPALHAADFEFLAFLVAVPTVGAYGLVQVSLQRAESSLVAAYIYLQPVIAVFGAAMLLDEQPTARTGVCGAIVLFGVWLAARRDQRA